MGYELVPGQLRGFGAVTFVVMTDGRRVGCVAQNPSPPDQGGGSWQGRVSAMGGEVFDSKEAAVDYVATYGRENPQHEMR